MKKNVMKNVAIWGSTFIAFVIIRIIIPGVVFKKEAKVGGFLDYFFLAMLLGLFQFIYGFVFKNKGRNEKDSEDIPPKE